MKKFAIGIPTLNRADLLIPALLYYKNDFPNTQILVFDNGNQDALKDFVMPNVSILVPEEPQSVAKSWNVICEIIFKNYDTAILLNDDIYWGKQEWEVEMIIDSDFFQNLGLITGTKHRSVMMLPKSTFEQVGNFDENFNPAYYEDNDFLYRIKLLGLNIGEFPILDPLVYRESSTIIKNPDLRRFILENKDYYVKKWGGEPNQEKFVKPFNF